MLLSAWLSREGITRMEFARRIGVSPPVVTDICKGKHWISRTTALAIERETKGEVTSNDFVHLSAPVEPGQAAD